ncbi:MAG: SurA N-terminal domain-containing protein [Gammaproteobacteria bacterium]|nr:SurA N-terminal domain-containing protein [Gammaproteobacteria bacterium]MDE0444309.1 SurA N-terminal domain-containing protein [Gammaproteobacteria bacterium]
MVLQKMRAGAQGIFAKVLVGAIVFVLAVTGFGAIQLFSGGEPIAATVNGDDITQRELEVETERERAAQRNRFGGEISDELLDRLIDRRAVLESLIVNTLVQQFARDLDLSVSERAVQRHIRSSFAGVDGFDDAMYRNWLAGFGHTPSSYQADQAARLLQNQIRTSLSETAFVTQRELRRYARILDQRRDIAYLLFDIGTFAAEVEVTEEEVEEHYGNFLDDYMTAEKFDFDYVRLLRAPFEAEVVIEETAIELAYHDEIAAVPEPGRRAAHILLEVNDERSVEDAVAVLSEVRSSIVDEGASFEERARAISEDLADDGGDLGVVRKGNLAAPELETALWALAPGEVSRPVQTEFGVHLIKFVEMVDVAVPSLAERTADIEAELRSQEADRLFNEMLREVDELAFEEGDTLDGLKERYGLEIETLEGATRSSRAGIFADQAVRGAAFEDDVLVGGYNSAAVATADAAVVVRLRQRHPPIERPIDEVREEIREQLAVERARRLTEDAAFDALGQLADGATPTELADSTGIAWQRADDMERTEPSVPAEIRATAFEMVAPPKGERVSDVSALGDGSRALVVLSNVVLRDYGAMSEADRSALARWVEQLVAGQNLEALIRTLRADASISAIEFTPSG